LGEQICVLRFYRKGARTAAEILVAAVLAYVVARYGIQLSFQIGRLSQPSGYDDVVYLINAQQWLNAVPTQGIFSNLAGLLNQHAPISTALAALSFAVAGPFDWPPYIANGFLLAACLLAAMVFLRFEKTPLLLASLIVLCLACVPFYQQTVTEFRPDLFAGIALGFCVLLLFREPVFDISPKRQFGLGLLFGVTLLMKPSTFLAVGFILAVALLLSCAGFLIERRKTLREKARPILLTFARLFAGAMVVFGPYLIAQGREILDYIYTALFTLADVNDLNASPAQQATFYLTGPAGGIALGLWFWIGMATIATRLAASWRLERNRLPTLCASYAALLVIYLVLTLTAVKQYFLGSMFYATFSLLMARDLAWLLPRAVEDINGFKFPYGAVLLIIALAVQRGFDPAPVLVTANPNSEMREATSRVTDLVWRLAKARAMPAGGASTPVTILTNAPAPVMVAAIVLQGSREHLDVRVSDGIYARSTGEFLALAAKADIIVIIGSINSPPYPGWRLGDDFDAAVAGNKAFESVTSLGNGFIQIFEKNTEGPAASNQR
jgi:hypothetical protein